MNRRSFLASLGFGGLALTAPKPLEIFAKLPAAVPPPMHVGVATLRGGFGLHDMGIELPASLYDPKMLADWMIHVVVRPPGNQYMRIVIESPADRCLTRLSGLPWSSGTPLEIYREKSERGIIDHVPNDHTLQIWVSPTRPPKAPLPPLCAILKASPESHPTREPMTSTMRIQRAQIDFARAVELGLVPASDPYETV